jgi:hypothetical protein
VKNLEVGGQFNAAVAEETRGQMVLEEEEEEDNISALIVRQT